MRKYIFASILALGASPALSQVYASDCQYCVRQPTLGRYYSCENAVGKYDPYSSGPYHSCSESEVSKDEDGNITRECLTFMPCAMRYSSNMKGNYIYVNVSSSCRGAINRAIRLAYKA
jgi:hypothetical protein